MSGGRAPLRRRYWSSLTGLGSGARDSLTGLGLGPGARRDWRGQPFRQRFVASFFVLPQPTRRPRPDTDTDTDIDTDTEPQRERSPWLYRYQSALLAGAAVVAAVAVSVTQFGAGGGPSRATAVGSGPSVGAASTSTGATMPGQSASTPAPSLVRRGPWQGTVRVEESGTKVTDGSRPDPGNIFGFGLSGESTLDGSGNLASWTQAQNQAQNASEDGSSHDGAPTAAQCESLLHTASTYQLTVHTGDRLCIATLSGGTAAATVAAEGTATSGSPYIDLDVVVFS